MSADTMFWLVVGSLLSTCFTAIGARALRGFSRRELEALSERYDLPLRLSEILRLHDRVALGVECLQVVATAFFVCSLTYFLWLNSQDAGPANWPSIWLAVGLSSLLLLVVETWLPAAIVRLWAAGFLFHTWRLWRGVAALMTPLVFGARFIDTMLHRLAGRAPRVYDEESFEDEIRTIVTEGHRTGLLEEDAREMIEGVIELGDADVSEIMTPRTDMVTMHVDLSIKEALDFAINAGHSRIPVYRNSRDDIVGIMFAKDLLPVLAKGPEAFETPLVDILRKPSFVPETKPIDVLLQEFQRTRSHMAIVLDEYGGVSGLVSIEDVLEEIVGEIVDEYDPDLVEGIRKIDDHVSEALARVHIDEINERLGLSLADDGDFDTIGGFVFSELGHVPKQGEQLSCDNVRITVLDATPRRIEKVRLEVLDKNGDHRD